jgi:endonuclease/exonuclease/phosphatase (EEP) superfamily protein YafD
MPSISLRCRCGKTITVAEQHRGKTIRCVQCGRTMRVGRFDIPLWLTWLSWAYLAAVALAWLVVWGLGDLWWPATVLLFISRWPFMLPLLVLIPAAIIYRRRLLVPLTVGGLIALVPVAGFHFGLLRLLGHKAGAPFRIVSFNVDGGQMLVQQLPHLLDEWRADVVGFQECDDEFRAAVENTPGWYHHTVRQLCLLSRDPITDSTVMDRRSLEQVKESDAGIGGTGDVARYTIQTPAGPFNITNLHLETPRKGFDALFERGARIDRLEANTELRSFESELARRWVNAGKYPTLVIGDFNTPIESRIFQDNWGDLTDAFARVGFGFGMTKNNGWIKVRIDHLLAGPGWHVDHVMLGQEAGSDHLPLIVDLTLVPATR